MNKYCAFGAMTPWRLGEVLEIKESYILIQPEYSKFKEYWDPQFVKIFDKKKQAIKETEKWID
ncbi:MAG: hypothetical protein WC755_09020 [Candidatus Woesearchaeota archaeon]|jgi:hypothetical protein